MVKEFFNYSLKPFFINDNKKWSVKDFLKLFILCYLGALFVGSSGGFVRKYLNLVDTTEVNLNLKALLIGIVIAPIFEEFLFRFLLKPERRKIGVYIIINVFILAVLIFKNSISIAILVSSISFIILLFCYLRTLEILIKFNLFKWNFYFVTLSFGFVHLFNLEGISGYNYLWTPILILPYIYMGFVFGFIRMKYGFINSVIFHFSINLFGLLGMYLTNS